MNSNSTDQPLFATDVPEMMNFNITDQNLQPMNNLEPSEYTSCRYELIPMQNPVANSNTNLILPTIVDSQGFPSSLENNIVIPNDQSRYLLNSYDSSPNMQNPPMNIAGNSSCMHHNPEPSPIMGLIMWGQLQRPGLTSNPRPAPINAHRTRTMQTIPHSTNQFLAPNRRIVDDNFEGINIQPFNSINEPAILPTNIPSYLRLLRLDDNSGRLVEIPSSSQLNSSVLPNHQLNQNMRSEINTRTADPNHVVITSIESYISRSICRAETTRVESTTLNPHTAGPSFARPMHYINNEIEINRNQPLQSRRLSQANSILRSRAHPYLPNIQSGRQLNFGINPQEVPLQIDHRRYSVDGRGNPFHPPEIFDIPLVTRGVNEATNSINEMTGLLNSFAQYPTNEVANQENIGTGGTYPVHLNFVNDSNTDLWPGISFVDVEELSDVDAAAQSGSNQPQCDRLEYSINNTSNVESSRRIQKKNERDANPDAAADQSVIYRRKLEIFKSQLQPPKGANKHFVIRVKRNNIFEDSFRSIFPVKNVENLKSKLWVVFDGEMGLDYGGVQREWFWLLSKEMFDPKYGFFEYTKNKHCIQINPNSRMYNENHLNYFFFMGRIMGMAVYHEKLVDAPFTLTYYMLILQKQMTFRNLKHVEPDYFNTTSYIYQNDPADLALDFSVNEERSGKIITIDLVPNGSNIPVTNENKFNYLKLYLNWKFVGQVKEQLQAFLRGFYDLIPVKAIKIFNENELESLICGVTKIDFRDLKYNTVYNGGYSLRHPTIKWFWQLIRSFNNEMRAKLLQFVTGTSRVPMNGFKELVGSSGPQLFTIKKIGSIDSLPTAHTCFNRLDLPPYESFEQLKEKLIYAIECCEGYGGVD